MRLALACVVTVVLLAITDPLVRAWNPQVLRLPQQFSPVFLQKQVQRRPDIGRTALVVGDSVMWGYGLPANQAVPSRLMAKTPTWNLSYEGGSPVNSYVLLRYVLSQRGKPRVVIFNVNQKQFNPENSAYDRLQTSVEAVTASQFDDFDRKTIVTEPAAAGVESELDRSVANVWDFFAQRVDVREALFNRPDAATALNDAIGNATGFEARQTRANVPTAGKFLGTYDLDPLTKANVSVEYLERLCSLIERNRIRALAILTPTNHALLHDYIDVPEYESNLRFTAAIIRKHGIAVLDADRTIPTSEFIDSDHLTGAGSQNLSRQILAALARSAP